jgi:hypothetical protein
MNSIGYFAKHASWRGDPIQCPNCKGLSFVAKQSTSWGHAAAIAPLFLPLVLFVTSSPLLVVAGVILVVAHEMTLHRVPLIAITTDEVAYTRKWTFGFAALILIGIATAVGVNWYFA